MKSANTSRYTTEDSTEALRRKLSDLKVPWSILMGTNELKLRLELEMRRQNGEALDCSFLDDIRKDRETKKSHAKQCDKSAQVSIASDNNKNNNASLRRTRSLQPKQHQASSSTNVGKTNSNQKHQLRSSQSVSPSDEKIEKKKDLSDDFEEIFQARAKFAAQVRANPLYKVHEFPINYGIPFGRVAQTTYKLYNTDVEVHRRDTEMMTKWALMNKKVAELQALISASTWS